MRIAFIHAKSNAEVRLPDDILQGLPNKIGIVTTVQHLHKIAQVRKQLPNAIMAGQVLGCRADASRLLSKKLDAFLYVGSGEFHPIEVALVSGKPVFCWNPLTQKFGELDPVTIQKYQKRVIGAVNKFYHAKNVGILVSTKRGQNNNMITSPTLRNKLDPVNQILERNDGKKYYLFAFNTLDRNELENYPFIDVWLNLACSRIFDDDMKNLVNWQDIVRHEASHE